MDYRKAYGALMAKASLRKEVSGYTESHHILPKSMGGSDDKSNIVDLTGREHFLAHKLLAKIYEGPMIYAFLMMCNARINEHGVERYKVSSRDYTLAKKLLSEKLKGVPHSEETKAKMAKAQRDRMKNPVLRAKCATRTGIPNSESQKAAISEKLKGVPKAKVPPCPHCGKICNKATAVRWHYDNCKLRK
ncbi:hypothetical protein [Klebsiella phage vB_Kpn_P545]|uniref:Nuclease associated modular domain-containing protein n=1 Tax=Klebsiella phage vB_Kpn_P545 TaxID=2686283 RepID=A0A6B9J9F0_9CAUD|nr:hypothetical protein [Klebsiella phage vB_Kpn_P545]